MSAPQFVLVEWDEVDDGAAWVGEVIAARGEFTVVEGVHTGDVFKVPTLATKPHPSMWL